MTRDETTFPSGGERCAAWHYRPEAPTRPVVVMAHGFGATRHAGLAAYAERFAAAGLGVLVFDYRHFGDSGGEPRQLLDIGRQLADLEAAVAHARTLPGADPGQVALWGTSYGGGHVLTVASRDRRIAAAVAQVPFVDGLSTAAAVGPVALARLTAAALRDDLRALRGREPYRVPLVGPPGTLAAMTTPGAEAGYRALYPPGFAWDDTVAARIFLRVAAYRPGRHAGRVRCPLLVCVADHDNLTPPGPAVRAAGRAPRGELLRYPVGHFDLYQGAWFEKSVGDQVEFFRRHLLGEGAGFGCVGAE
jgi:alpha-beta hydrolase superfamily lysophospholipase